MGFAIHGELDKLLLSRSYTRVLEIREEYIYMGKNDTVSHVVYTMPHKGQMNGVCRHNNSSVGGLWGRSGDESGLSGVKRPSSPTVRGCASTLVAGLIGFICGILVVNWCKVGVSSRCGMKGICCTEIRISPLGSAQQPLLLGGGGGDNSNILFGNEVADGVARSSSSSSPKHKDNFIFVGIMTAKKFIDNRGLASHRTWARTINGRVMFFSSEDSTSAHRVPVVALPNVDDRYPPQKKSFMMLKYMHDHYLDKFEWFMRADDDVFIKGDKLDAFLRGINSSQALFIGQAGTGKAEELGKLSLAPDENFCMGGPGMIFSRETLRRMAPHISFCLRNLYTSHEDVEIGRCVRKFAGIQCTWSYEVLSTQSHSSITLYSEYLMMSTTGCLEVRIALSRPHDDTSRGLPGAWCHLPVGSKVRPVMSLRLLVLYP
ncbi:hypothetical protein RRG08_040937 [Elysia crispata]|uniref:N-acetylgalactosaminyl-proteoglycan 3-beta-glucuronosyltransferase n=1 Tax=Elysia crispata TaxID=231223 RepID=A0AAE0XQZ3_9GAST|nr:hypothetical protein RRG08_040937 [Elysia crispata]